MKTLRASFFSLMLVILIKRNILNFLFGILAQVDTLRKKQLTASFVEHFKENDENTISVYFAVVI